MMTHGDDTLREIRQDCAGQPFRCLVELYTVRHRPEELAADIRASLSHLSGPRARAAARLYNRWNLRGQDPAFLELDSREALRRVERDALREFPADASGEDEEVLEALRLVTLGLALTAALFPGARRRMGVRTAPEMAGRPDAGEAR